MDRVRANLTEPLMSPARFLALSCLVAVIPGCARFPELDAAVSEEAKAAPNPVLIENAPALAPARTTLLSEDTQAALSARAEALQARAEVAAGPVISDAEAQEISERAALLRAEAARVAPDG